MNWVQLLAFVGGYLIGMCATVVAAWIHIRIRDERLLDAFLSAPNISAGILAALESAPAVEPAQIKCPHCLDTGEQRGVYGRIKCGCKEPAQTTAIRTIWTHHSAQAETKPWTAMYICDGENPFERLSQFGEMAGQKYGNTEIEAIAALIGEPAQAVQSESCSNLMWATAKMREREHNRIGKMVGVLEQIKQEKLSALEQAQAVPPGYRLQAIAEFDAMNELIRSNDALTIAYMSGKHDQKAIDHGKKQRAIDFVRWVVSLQTGGLIQVRANELLNLLETENE